MCKLVEDGNFFSASFRAQNAAADQSHNRRPQEKVDKYMALGTLHSLWAMAHLWTVVAL